MDNIEEKADSGTFQKYLVLASMISRTENRLGWTELIYLSLNIFLFLFLMNITLPLLHESGFVLALTDLLFIFLTLTIGIFLNIYWIASVMRMQLKLMLRYFQARFLERKLDITGAYIFSDESVFFNSSTPTLNSPDKKETLKYPTSGLTSMDGFIGSARPRVLSWMMACLFIVIYWITFIWIVANI